MNISSRLPSMLALGAVLSMAATPAAAVDLPIETARATAPEATEAAPAEDSADRHRYRRYRRNRVDAGDVVAGVLILGGIAAIASAASRSRDDRYRDREYRNRDYRYRDRRDDSRYESSSGIDNAVNMCVGAVERDVRVDSVDSVDRTGQGWRVSGRLFDGNGFTCRIGNDGRIDGIDYGAGGTAYSTSNGPSDDRQWDDARYRSARANTGYAGPGSAVEPQPSYPGGPVAGDYEYAEDDVDGGRYD